MWCWWVEWWGVEILGYARNTLLILSVQYFYDKKCMVAYANIPLGKHQPEVWHCRVQGKLQADCWRNFWARLGIKCIFKFLSGYLILLLLQFTRPQHQQHGLVTINILCFTLLQSNCLLSSVKTFLFISLLERLCHIKTIFAPFVLNAIQP